MYTAVELNENYCAHVETKLVDGDGNPIDSYDIAKKDNNLWVYRFIRHLGSPACPICNQVRAHEYSSDHCDNVATVTSSSTEEVVELLNSLAVSGEHTIELRKSHYDLTNVTEVTIPIRRKAKEKGELPIVIVAKYKRSTPEYDSWIQSFDSFPGVKTFCDRCGYNKSHDPSCNREYKQFTTARVTAALEEYYDNLQDNESVIYATLHIG